MMQNKMWWVAIGVVAVAVIAVLIGTSGGGIAEKPDLIKVTAPRINAKVASPLTIEGEARGNWYFEASFPVVMEDADGKVLGQMPMQADGDWMTENFVPFKGELTFSEPTTETGTLVLKKDNPSGLPENEDELRIPVRFMTAEATPPPTETPPPTSETMQVKAYFGKTGSAECENVVAVTRTIPKTQSVARASLTALLEGPTAAEKDQGYTTAINAGVTIKSLAITNGVLHADFSSALGSGVAGSCRVNAIRAQIEQTMKQFSTVSSVTISIDGTIEGILQP